MHNVIIIWECLMDGSTGWTKVCLHSHLGAPELFVIPAYFFFFFGYTTCSFPALKYNFGKEFEGDEIIRIISQRKLVSWLFTRGSGILVRITHRRAVTRIFRASRGSTSPFRRMIRVICVPVARNAFGDCFARTLQRDSERPSLFIVHSRQLRFSSSF